MTELLTLIIIFLSSLVVAFIANYLTVKLHKSKGFKLEESMNSVGLLIVTIKNDNRNFNFLIDTGSDVSHINQKDIKKFMGVEYSKDAANDKFLVSTGNGVIETDNTVVNIPFYYNNSEYTEQFYPLDLTESFKNMKKECGIQLHGILGNTFFNKYNMIIDFNDCLVYSK